MNKVRLGDLLHIKHGYAFKSVNYVEKSQFAMVTLANISEANDFQVNFDKITYYGAAFPKEFTLQAGDLIMPLTEQVIGLFGNSAFVPHINGLQFVLNQRVGKIIPDKGKIDKYYLHFLLSTESVREQLEHRASGTKQRNISPDDVYDIVAFIPTLDEQKKIGKILYDIERKININHKINDNLQQQLKLLYDYWFTQFDFPDENGKPYRSSSGQMVWNDTLKRDIPLGWHVSKLSEICSIVLGGTPSTSNPNYWNGNIDWLNSGEVSQFPVIKSSMKISKLGLDNSPAKLMPKGTTVVSITGNIRSSILAIDASANQSVVGILESNSIRCPFIYPYIDNMLDQYSRISTGNCQQHINKGTIEDSIVVVPDEKILAAYYSISQPIYDEVAQRALECFSLTNLRDWLLPMLMNGQATITD